jgi:hypothetical protein
LAKKQKTVQKKKQPIKKEKGFLKQNEKTLISLGLAALIGYGLGDNDIWVSVISVAILVFLLKD